MGSIWNALGQQQCNESCALTKLSYVESIFWEKLPETTVIGSKMEGNLHCGVFLEVDCISKGERSVSHSLVYEAETRVGRV